MVIASLCSCFIVGIKCLIFGLPKSEWDVVVFQHVLQKKRPFKSHKSWSLVAYKIYQHRKNRMVEQDNNIQVKHSRSYMYECEYTKILLKQDLDNRKVIDKYLVIIFESLDI